MKKFAKFNSLTQIRNVEPHLAESCRSCVNKSRSILHPNSFRIDPILVAETTIWINTVIKI